MTTPPVMATAEGRTFQFTLVTGPPSRNRLAKNLALLLAGAATALAYAAYRRRKNRRKAGFRSNPVLMGAEVLETRAAVDRLLQQHFGSPKEVLPELFISSDDQIEALKFASRLGVLCERHCPALFDFTGEFGEPSALDLGCGVGATTFELARAFPRVIGVDSAKACINAAKTLKDRGWMRYSSPEEGDLSLEHSAVVPKDIDRDRVNFTSVTDLSSLPKPLTGPHDAVLAANVLCRLPDPRAFLLQLPFLVRPGGIAVIASAYDWKDGRTPRAGWLGGYKGQDGREVYTEAALKEIMGAEFELVAEENLPCCMRETRRKYQLKVSHATVWKRK